MWYDHFKSRRIFRVQIIDELFSVCKIWSQSLMKHYWIWFSISWSSRCSIMLIAQFWSWRFARMIWYISWSQTIVDTYVATLSSCKLIASRSMIESNRCSENAQARIIKSNSKEAMHSSHEKLSYVSDFSFRDMSHNMLRWRKKSRLHTTRMRMIKHQNETWSEKRWIRSST